LIMAASTPRLLGRFDEALQLDRRAVDLDPLNAGSWESLAETEFYIGRLDQAATDARKALELSPDVFPGHLLSGKISVLQGRPEEVLREVQLVRYDAHRVFLSSMAYDAMGRHKESDTALRELIAKDNPPNPYLIATVYAFLNRADQAFEWLDRAYANRDSDVIGTEIDPLLKSLHNDPRYAAFLKKMHLPK